MIASTLVIIALSLPSLQQLNSFLPDQTPCEYQVSCIAQFAGAGQAARQVMIITATRGANRDESLHGMSEWKQRLLSAPIQQFPHPFTVRGTELGARIGLGSGRGTCCARPDGAPRAVIRYSGYAEIPCSCRSSP